MPSKRQCWLLKSEPSCYSIDDLQRDKRTHWDGVRNYQSRNYMRDDMKPGDEVLFYHSSEEPIGVAGVAKISKAAYADFTALDPKEDHFDPKASREEPIWVMVDVAFVEKFPRVLPLAELKACKQLEGMLVLKRGIRLSVQPVNPKHFDVVRRLGRAKE